MTKHAQDITELQIALEKITTVIPSGSYFISGNTKNDIDFFVFGTEEVHDWLRAEGFECSLHAVSEDQMKESMKGVDGFVSYRAGKFNVICINKMEKLKKIKLATELAIALKLKDKTDVLRVFNAIQLGVVSDSLTITLEKQIKRGAIVV